MKEITTKQGIRKGTMDPYLSFCYDGEEFYALEESLLNRILVSMHAACWTKADLARTAWESLRDDIWAPLADRIWTNDPSDLEDDQPRVTIGIQLKKIMEGYGFDFGPDDHEYCGNGPSSCYSQHFSCPCRDDMVKRIERLDTIKKYEDADFRLMCGELSAQDLRNIRAVLNTL